MGGRRIAGCGRICVGGLVPIKLGEGAVGGEAVDRGDVCKAGSVPVKAGGGAVGRGVAS